MLTYDIPGLGEIKIENLVFDYNGTIAVDGELISGVKELFCELKKHANIYILTADTYGTAEAQCTETGISIETFPKGKAAQYKKEFVEEIGADKTICIGNGFNDIEMFKTARLSIGVIEKEGCSGKLLVNSDVIVNSMIDAAEVLLKGKRLKATLRE